MRTRYLRIMEKSLSAYSDAHLRRYLDEVKRDGRDRRQSGRPLRGVCRQGRGLLVPPYRDPRSRVTRE